MKVLEEKEPTTTSLKKEIEDLKQEIDPEKYENCKKHKLDLKLQKIEFYD